MSHFHSHVGSLPSAVRNIQEAQSALNTIDWYVSYVHARGLAFGVLITTHWSHPAHFIFFKTDRTSQIFELLSFFSGAITCTTIFPSSIFAIAQEFID